MKGEVKLSEEKARRLAELCLTGAAMLEASRARVKELESALEDIRLALDSQYGADMWSISRVLERVGQ